MEKYKLQAESNESYGISAKGPALYDGAVRFSKILFF